MPRPGRLTCHRIMCLEGSFKMSQNRSEADRAGVAAALQASADPTLCAVAELVRGVRQRT